jgi:RNase P/RNase MRP subunit POP5
MQKIKRLLPSLREKKRYLCYEVSTKHPLKKDISAQVKSHVERTLGLFDSAEAGLLSISYDGDDQRGIMKMNNRYVEKVRVALMLLQAEDIGMSEDVLVHTKKVSGNLGKLAS